MASCLTGGRQARSGCGAAEWEPVRRTPTDIHDKEFKTRVSPSQMPLAGFGPDPVPQPQPKDHKAFDRLVKKIHAARERLAAWGTVLAPYQERFTKELLPLHASCRTLRIRFVQRLDGALGEKGLTQTERRAVKMLIVELAASLLSEGDDPELRALYERHGGRDHGGHRPRDLDEAAAAFEAMYGTGQDDPIEEILRRAAEAMGADGAPRGRKAPPKAEGHRIRQSIRTLYRKLASALHPDREPDPDQRDRKTALMQKANHAYENDRLLPLLELRRELDPTQGVIAGESADDVKLYTQALKGELEALEEEVMAAEIDFRGRFAIDPLAALTPGNALKTLAADIGEMRAMADALEAELTEVRDIPGLKRWLRVLRDGDFG